VESLMFPVGPGNGWSRRQSRAVGVQQGYWTSGTQTGGSNGGRRSRVQRREDHGHGARSIVGERPSSRRASQVIKNLTKYCRWRKA